jgi:hypothetical protein
MSTTNPPTPGDPQPGAGRQWPADAAHGSAPDDHGGGGGVDPAALRAGHEPDAFYVKPILSIPLAVVVAFVIGFAVAAGAFAYFRAEARKPDPFAHPEEVARNAQSLNEQLLRTERAGFSNNPVREGDQPRLEPLRRREGDGLFYARTEMPTGNSPEIHPEDIRPDRVAALQRAGYVDHDKKFARIPIADAMKVAVGNKELFPVQKSASKPVATADRPSASNGGQGVAPPAAPKVEAKKNEAKKDGGKKEPAPKPPEPKAPEKK